MTTFEHEPATRRRRTKTMLSAEEKFDLWTRMLCGQLTVVDAAAESGVDRTTIQRIRKVARDGAIAALEASKPGRRRSAAEESELAKLRAENARLEGVIVDQAIELSVLRGKAGWA